MKKVTCNGVTLNYQTVGEGPDVVLIHGLAANHAFWRLDVLLSLTKKYRVTVFDLRGHGYSGMPPTGYTSADMAEDMHQLFGHLHITGAHIIGHSLGGVVALHYAVLHPERVLSVTIADSRIRTFQPTNYAKEWPNWERAFEKLESVDLMVPEDEAESGLWLLEQIAAPEWQELRYKLKGSSLFVPFGGWNGGQKTADRWMELMHTTTAKHDLCDMSGLTAEQITAVRAPVFALYGENSPTLPTLGGLQRCLPGCRATIIPGAGHFFPLTKAKLFIDQITRFLNAIEEKTPC